MSPFASASDDIIRRILYISCKSLRYYNSRRPKSFSEQERILLTLTHICRQWRLVAIDMPILWSYLILPAYGLEQVAEYLKRSRTAPLVVYMDVADFQVDPHDRSVFQRMKSYFPLIDNHVERIEKLCMIGNEEFFADDILSSYLNRASNVQDLTVGHGRVPLNRWFPNGDMTFPLSADRFPNLQKLHVMPLIRSPVPISIRTDKLTHLSITDDEVDLTDLKRLLVACESLTSLRILEMSNDEPTWEAADDQVRRVRLPLLSELYLGYLHVADTLSTAYILHFLDLPQLASFDFSLSHNWGKVNITDILIPTNIPRMAKCQSVKFRLSDIFCLEAIGTRAVREGVKEYTFRFSIADYPLYSVIVDRFRQMKDNFFPGIMYFELDLAEGGHISPDPWLQLLESLPMLETIKFRMRGESDNQVEGRSLIIKVLSACYSVDDSVDPKWPLLRIIELDGFQFSDTDEERSTLRTLICMLTSRNNAGYRLPELRVPNAKSLSTYVLTELQALVGKLVID